MNGKHSHGNTQKLESSPLPLW